MNTGPLVGREKMNCYLWQGRASITSSGFSNQVWQKINLPYWNLLERRCVRMGILMSLNMYGFDFKTNKSSLRDPWYFSKCMMCFVVISLIWCCGVILTYTLVNRVVTILLVSFLATGLLCLCVLWCRFFLLCKRSLWWVLQTPKI